MSPKRNAALLIVGHGSTVNPDSSTTTLAHAAEIRRRKLFAEVACAFWKEEPSLRDALFLFDSDAVCEVYVAPNFISEGYFTQTVIPRELELNGRITKRSSGQIWKYCEPVGNHPGARKICGRAECLHGRITFGLRLAKIDDDDERRGSSVFHRRWSSQLRRHSG